MAEVELRTAPADFRFPTTNQTRHCFTRYIEFHRCLAVKGEEASECDKFAKYYRSLCPGEWLPNATVLLFPLVVVLVAILVLCMPLNVEIDAKGQSEFMDGDNEKDYDHHHHNNGNIYPSRQLELVSEKQLKVHAEKKYRDEDTDVQMVPSSGDGQSPVERWNEQRENGSFPGPL